MQQKENTNCKLRPTTKATGIPYVVAKTVDIGMGVES